MRNPRDFTSGKDGLPRVWIPVMLKRFGFMACWPLSVMFLSVPVCRLHPVLIVKTYTTS